MAAARRLFVCGKYMMLRVAGTRFIQRVTRKADLGMTKDKMVKLWEDYAEQLRNQELKESSKRKYKRDIQRFLEFLPEEGKLQKDWVIAYKRYLTERYQPVSVNSYLMSVNRFLRCIDRTECVVKLEKIQKRYSLDHVLTIEDYDRLLFYAHIHGKKKYYCIMRTLAATGIRVGELRYITCEAVNQKMAVIHHKNKIRHIYLPDRLCSLLKEYQAWAKISEGCLFCGRDQGRPMDTSSIWKGLKRLAIKAGVDSEKVYPHSFRHLFARTYMKEIGNLAELSDLLGHSSIETTRIYTMGTAEEKRESLDRMRL